MNVQHMELLTNCLQICDWDIKKASKMFSAEFPASHGFYERYAYKLYYEILKKEDPAKNKKLMENKTIHELMRASNRALEDNDIDRFVDVTKQKMNMLGYGGGKGGVNLNQYNVSQNISIEDVMNDIKSISEQLRIPVPAAIDITAQVPGIPAQASGDVGAGSLPALPAQSQASPGLQ